MRGETNNTNKSKVNIGKMIGAGCFDEGLCSRIEVSGNFRLGKGMKGLGIVR